MRLTHYTLRRLFIPIMLIFTAWGVIFCSMILHEVEDETDDSLSNFKEIIIRSALSDSTLLRDHVDIMTRYYIREVDRNETKLYKDEFYDSLVYIELEKEHEPVRTLRTYFMTDNGRYYELTLQMSTLEQEDMIETIIWSMAILYILLIGCILLVIHQGFKSSFRPLFNLLEWLKEFQVGKVNRPLVNDTAIDEFKILNDAVEESTKQSEMLYNRQRQFVENAAHELQTPLAVCMNRLELLSEHKDCTDSLLQEMAGLHYALNGIIRLNKSLLLLSRIENKQFPETRDVNINQLTHDIIDNIKEIYEEKGIKITIKESGTIVCNMNDSLASTLIMNLVKNAYVHNVNNGKINIELSDDRFVIENSGYGEIPDTDKMFTRFSSQTKSSESTGLGLAIVKSIAGLYSIDVRYSYRENSHIFTLLFPHY